MNNFSRDPGHLAARTGESDADTIPHVDFDLFYAVNGEMKPTVISASTNMVKPALRVALVFTCLALTVNSHAADSDSSSQPDFRRPLAMAIDGNALFIANETGSVARLNVNTRQLTRSWRFMQKRSLAVVDIAVQTDTGQLFTVQTTPNGPSYLAINNTADGRLLSQIKIGMGCGTVIVSAKNNWCTVTSRWSRWVQFINITTLSKPNANDTENITLAHTSTIKLPFSPRCQWLSDDEKHLVVADTSGGHLAVIDVDKRKLLAIRTIAASNIRGLSTSADGKRLNISHCFLEPNNPTTKDMVFYGFVVSSVIRSVALSDLLAARSNNPLKPTALGHWQITPLGESKNGAGDPGQLIVDKAGRTIVCLSGVNELAVRNGQFDSFTRIKVGTRPEAVALSGDNKLAFVANRFSDSISVIDLARRVTIATISLSNRNANNKQSPAKRGEQLFHDARLSFDKWFSCSSCHSDGHTNHLLNDNLDDQTIGTPKRVISLLGVEKTAPFGWTGSQLTLESQVQHSLSVTMQGIVQKKDTRENVKALTAYLRTLSPPPSLAKARSQMNSAAAQRGKRIFNLAGCNNCHKAPNFTSTKTFKVGLSDEHGHAAFNPPSLLGVSQRDTFFHNAKAKSLKEIITRFKHAGSDELTEKQIDDLISFLNQL